MAEHKETEVERDAEGRVIGYKERIEKRRGGGGFGWGMLFGVIVIAGAIVAFAYSQGSFQTAGVQADQATAVASREIDQAANQTGAAVDNAADNAQQTANNLSDGEDAAN